MLNSIKGYFEKYMAVDNKKSSDDNRRRLQIATCALLIEMANCDDNFGDNEKTRIIDIIKKRFEINDKQIDELFEITRQEIKNSLDLYGFARIINKNHDESQKVAVIELVWEVIYADGILSAYEDYLVHKYQKMLNLTHQQLIDAKMRALERLNEDK
ncbi:MAG: TerB family tellurite resistance protein [candidate division Zixibacteria bacterium]|nr:TerB family tellurite resistance protein [candidate division Zixibacteria bacterium]